MRRILPVAFSVGWLFPHIRRILTMAFSVGWLFPLWLSGETMFSFLDAEVWPRLRGQNPLNSFPFVGFSERTFTVACIWLATVVAYWAWRWSGFMESKQPKPNA